MKHLKIKIVLVVIFLAITSNIYYATESNKTKQIDVSLKKEIETLQIHYELALQNFKIHSLGAYNSFKKNKDVIEILTKAQTASKIEKQELRDKLQKLLKNQYKRLQDKGVFQLHFALPNNRSFFRMHRPNKFGDDLTIIRPSIIYVNKTKKPISGFENGKFNHSFRYVYPLFNPKTNQYLGSVETSFYSKKIQENLTNLNKIHTHFIVRKDIFGDRKIDYTSKSAYYHQSIEHKDFLYATDFIKNHDKLENSEISIIKPLQDKIKKNMALNKEFALYIPAKNEIKVIAFLPIKTILNNKTKAYLVSYSNNIHVKFLIEQNNKMRIIFLFTLIILFVFVYKLLVGKSHLEDLVKIQTKKLLDTNTNLENIVREEIIKNKEKESLLMQQSKMASMGEMMESIAHQWRQPLSVITTASSGMKMQQEFGMLNDKLLISSCDSITTSAEHLSQTIDDFRNFFKKDKVKRFFSVNDIFHKTMALLVSKFKNREIEIVQNMEDVELNGYPNELVQVFMNVLNNARDELEIKKQRRLIFVDIHKKNDTVTIKIKDNAGGIPKDIIPKVFDSHFTTKKDKEGTGIGLYMSKKIVVDSFSGTIEVTNVNYTYEDEEYIGAEFTITLANN